MIGEVVGNYRVTAKLAEGGMGAVYKAEHALIGKPAAVKVLLPELSANQDVVNRFFNEAKAATAIRHPGIVEIFDFGYLANGVAYIVMELLDGEPLSKVLVARGGRITEHEALGYVRGMASALSAAHAQGIIHRDLKPDNVFIVRDPDVAGGLRTKILDFGIAKMTEAQRVAGSTKTRTGAVLGTPTYMSPEQCRGVGELDHRSDLYAVGCILYEMLVGRPPFASEGIGELLAMHMYMPPPPPSDLGVVLSVAVESLIMQLLQKDPGQRVQSAADLARLLGQGSSPALAGSIAPTMALPTPSPALQSGMRTPAPVFTPGFRATAGGATAAAPTTLSAAAGGSADPVRRSSRAPIFVVVGLVAAAGIAAVFVLGGKGNGSNAAATPPPAVIDAGVTADAAPPPPVVDAAAPAVDAPPPPVDAAIDAPRRGKDRPKNGGDRNGSGSGSQGSGSGSATSSGSGSGSVDRGD